MNNYSRRLNDVESFNHFFKAISYNIEDRYLPDFVSAELLTITEYEQTSTSKSFRLPTYASDEARWELRKKIVSELFSNVRLKDDEDIKLGLGGALPNSELKKDRQAYIVIGLPASGKSGIANLIADKNGAIILDSDYAKRKIPEFEGFNMGASLVHSESSGIIFPSQMSSGQNDFKTLSQLTLEQGINFVQPTIGQDFDSLINYAKSLKKPELNYQVHLILVNLDRKLATHRAIERYIKTKRYVPLGLVFDCYSNDPTLNYYYAKKKARDVFESFGEISTNVAIGKKPICTDIEGESPVNLYK